MMGEAAALLSWKRALNRAPPASLGSQKQQTLGGGETPPHHAARVRRLQRR